MLFLDSLPDRMLFLDTLSLLVRIRRLCAKNNAFDIDTLSGINVDRRLRCSDSLRLIKNDLKFCGSNIENRLADDFLYMGLASGASNNFFCGDSTSYKTYTKLQQNI